LKHKGTVLMLWMEQVGRSFRYAAAYEISKESFD
jgi:hypothetical protein